MPRKKPSKEDVNVNQPASMLGKRSAEARRKKWGDKEFARKMREWGKLGAEHGKKGGRPPKKKE